MVEEKTSMSKEENFIQEVLKDFRICCISREASLLARKEVLTGKAKFGIIGDGKEVPQVAMARAFKKGDFRSGYYRDQTFMFALDLCTLEEFFAQLYADTEGDPFSGGRQMNSHYATPLIDSDGQWLAHKDHYNISADISPTAGQMARSLGIAQASQVYRNREVFSENTLSKDGNEVCFVTIGDASTSEGVFWETLNAAGVMQVPMAISVWDDGYGISVPREYQTTKGSISKVLEGFRADDDQPGVDIYRVKGWDYPALCELYERAIEKVRRTHAPALIHVEELTQPQGHSTSGSHERYKSKERLEWEKQHDCIEVMKQWILSSDMATAQEVEKIQEEAKQEVRAAKQRAWKAYHGVTKESIKTVQHIYQNLMGKGIAVDRLQAASKELDGLFNPVLTEVVKNARQQFHYLAASGYGSELQTLGDWLDEQYEDAEEKYHTHLYSESPQSALRVPVVPARYAEDAPMKNGYQILNQCFDKALERYPQLLAFGEDVGQIGDVNQGFAGLQEKYGEARVFDTGIREWTIVGQAIGMAMRGLRPIAEIQYLDYLLYGLEPLSDDLATLRYRSKGQQMAPVIIRTRGHRLEGIWHTGSPIGMLLGALRGMYVLVPRNMTQAAGFYNTLLQSDDPALVIECLNGYRLKEALPENLDTFTVPLGVPEVLREGTDVTLVTYGSCVRVAEEGARQLEEVGISVELIDVQSLLPFDLEHRIVESLRKTNRIVFMDEDFPGGATAYMMREVLEVQGGYRWLDAQPVTLTAHAHRSPFGSDGDYFSKPQAEDVFRELYALMHEFNPSRFPAAW